MQNPLYKNLSASERAEYARLGNKLSAWITHLEVIRAENKTRRKIGMPDLPFDGSLSVSDAEHFRLDDLRSKAYGRIGPYMQSFLKTS